MPWIEGDDDNPSVYRKPYTCDEVSLGQEPTFSRAVEQRKVYARQKDGIQLPKEERREAKKSYSGFDYVIKYMEGNPEYNNWRTPRANEDLAPYIDNAFYWLEIRT